jgi:tetratricopeptide (TPR) repeat protein
MRFCPECGTPVVAGAKFCVECGQPLAAGQAPVEGSPPSAIPRASTGPAFVAVFAIIVLAGLGAIYFIRRQTPAPQPATIANSGAEGGEQKLPPGHPKVELPAEARKIIEDLRHKAEAKPTDLALWNRLGEVLFRASQLDPVYSPQAMDAYAHVLKIDPDNLDALRGVGNVDYDRGNYDQAVAAYEHYLKKKPDDADVRTDLGTMYLYTGNADQALVQYKKVIAQKPSFFEAYFNMGIAYTRMNDPAKASDAFDHAIKTAPDDQTRARIKDAIAKVTGTGAAAANEEASAGGAAAGASAPAGGGATAPANTFEGAIENMLRGIRFMGPKVASVEWPAKNKALVLLDQFPMDQMPPFAKQKFLSDLKSGIDKAKADYKINGSVEVDLADSATRKTMETVTE